MKLKIKKMQYPLIAIVLVLMLAVSCKKDEKKNEKPTPTIIPTLPTTNTVTDIDGNVYKTVTIGTQTWMAENLKVTKYNDGTAIPLITDNTAWESLTTPAYCWFNNDATNKNTYGALYNWYTVNTGKLAPTGWHVSTDAEWTTMENYLMANGYNYDGTTTGNKYAKAMASTTGWAVDATPGTVGNTDYPNFRNKSGFTALMGGGRGEGGYFLGQGVGLSSSFLYFAGWWTSTERSSSSAWSYTILNNCSYVERSLDNIDDSTPNYVGLSVRCIKN